MTAKEALDRANPSELGALFYHVQIGSFLSALSTPVVTAELDVTTHVVVLPSVALHLDIIEATAGNSTGTKIPQLSATPASGYVRVGSDGQTLTFNSTDAVTKCLVRYVPVPTQATKLAETWSGIA